MRPIIRVRSHTVVPFLFAACAGVPEQADPPASMYAVARESARVIFTEAPLTFDAGRIIVPVIIADDTLQFILDSAAGGSVISLATRALIDIEPSSVRRDTIIGAGGPQELESVGIGALQVGEYSVPGLRAAVIDLRSFGPPDAPAFGGILGLDFLRHFDVDLDIDAGRIRLYRQRAGAAPRLLGLDTLRRVAFDPGDSGFIGFDGADVDGAAVRVLLDTGASASILNWHAARRAGVDRSSAGLRTHERPTGGIGSAVTETHLYTFGSIGMNGAWHGPVELRIADLPVFQLIGMGDAPSMLMGTDLIRDCRVFISYSTAEVFFCDRQVRGRTG